MNALEKFTTPDPFDEEDKDRPYAPLGTGPEHSGVTFVKIRRALKHVIEDLNLMRLEIDQDDEQACAKCSCSFILCVIIISISLVIGLCVAFACSPNEKRYYLN